MNFRKNSSSKFKSRSSSSKINFSFSIIDNVTSNLFSANIFPSFFPFPRSPNSQKILRSSTQNNLLLNFPFNRSGINSFINNLHLPNFSFHSLSQKRFDHRFEGITPSSTIGNIWQFLTHIPTIFLSFPPRSSNSRSIRQT